MAREARTICSVAVHERLAQTLDDGGKLPKSAVQDVAMPAGQGEPLDSCSRIRHAEGSALTCVATWRGLVQAAFGIVAHSRNIIGWRVRSSIHAGLVLGPIERSVYDRRPGDTMPQLRTETPRPGPGRQSANGKRGACQASFVAKASQAGRYRGCTEN